MNDTVLVRRIGPLSVILLLHAALFYALAHGLQHKSVRLQSQPREIVATLLMPAPPAPAPPTIAQPAPPSPPKRTTPSLPKKPPQVAKPAPKPRPQPLKPPKPEPEKTQAPPLPAPAPALPPTDTPAPATAPSPIPPAPPAQAAPPAPPAPPKTVAGVEYLEPPRPVYPSMSRRMGEEGKTVLRVLIEENGHAGRIEILHSSGSSRLDEAARQAVRHASFKPYRENGKALAVFALIPINFQLD